MRVPGRRTNLSVDSEEVGGLAKDGLSKLSPSHVIPVQIERFFEHYRLTQMPTNFDSGAGVAKL